MDGLGSIVLRADWALRDLDLSIGAGEIVCLLGLQDAARAPL